MLHRRLKKEFRFSSKDIGTFVAVAILSGIILSFRMWGEGKAVDINAGIESIIIMSIMSFIAIFVHFCGEKFYAIWKGMETKYYANLPALGIGLFLAVLTNGFAFILAPGYLMPKVKRKARVGKWRYRPYLREYGYMANFGILANVLIAAIFGAFIANPIINKLVIANVLIAAFSLIPAPRYDGLHLFFGSFYNFAFSVGFTIAFAVTLFYAGVGYAILTGIVLGLIGFFTIFNKGWE